MQNEPRETAHDRPVSETVANARQRLADLAGTAGVRSPEYATGLNQLALLLIMQGDPEAAEPLLRQALEIRRSSLGELHPDYATNLSSLGGLLWARGDLDRAEQLLRQALEVRTETLGPSHPKSVVSLKSLEQLLKAKADRVGVSSPTPATTGTQSPAPTSSRTEGPDGFAPNVPRDVADTPGAAPSVVSEAEDAGYEAIAAGRDRALADFESLAVRLARAGEHFLSGVLPPEDDLPAAWTQARGAFTRLSRDATDAARVGAVFTPPGGLTSLAEISAILPSLRAAEEARVAARTGRRGALLVLDRIDRLGCPTDPTFAPLAACQARAQGVRRSVEESPPGELPPEARELNEGGHPLAILLRLLEADDTTGDAQWADWYDTVAAAFGDTLAVASARSRITATGPGIPA